MNLGKLANNWVVTAISLGWIGRWLSGSGWVMRLVLVGVAVAIIGLFAPERPTITPPQQALVADLALAAAKWVQSVPGVTREATYFGNFAEDPFATVSHPVREAIARTDRLRLTQRRIDERFRELIQWDLPTTDPSTQLLQEAARAGATYAVGGRVRTFREVGGEARLEVEAVLLEVASGRELSRQLLVASRGTALSQALAETATLLGTPAMSFPTRMGLWILATTLLPVLLLPVRRPLFERASNGVLLGVLVALILSSVGLGWFLMGYGRGEVLATAILLLCFASASGYYYYALQFIRDRLE